MFITHSNNSMRCMHAWQELRVSHVLWIDCYVDALQACIHVSSDRCIDVLVLNLFVVGQRINAEQQFRRRA
jgi:hypothetical protein